MKLFKKCIVALLVIASVFCVAPMFNNTVEAATKKVSTKYDYEKLKNQKNYKKIPEVKKGKTIVTMKKQDSYVKFTAKKTAKYNIKISNVKKPNASLVNGYISFYKLKTTSSGYKYFDRQKVKTYGGKTYSLELANKNFLKGWKNSGKKIYYYKSDRTATIKLKKGESIYFGGYFAGGKSNKTTYTVKISQVK